MAKEEVTYKLAYGTSLNDLSLTDLHRVVRHLQRRQRLVWLRHRQRRLVLMVKARRQRLEAIVERHAGADQ